MSAPLRVLFVCTANICRSPFMELLADHLAGGTIEVSSAGTHALEGRPVDADMMTPLLSRGVAADRAEAFLSRPLSAAMVADADVVLTAEAAHCQLILDRQPDVRGRVLTLGQFSAAARESAGATGHHLLEAIGERPPPHDPALDLADPYRRGSEAAALCARQVESLLRVAVPALSGSGIITS